MRFKIEKQEIRRIDDDKIASFARNHIHATFYFDGIWKDLRKFALFVTPDGQKYVVDLQYGKEVACIVPSEVLENSFFKVSCFADDLLTTCQETIIVYPSGYSHDIDEFDLDDDNISSTNDNDDIHRIKYEDVCYIPAQKQLLKDEHLYN